MRFVTVQEMDTYGVLNSNSFEEIPLHFIRDVRFFYEH